MRRDTFESYADIRHNVDQALLVVSSRLSDLIDHEAQKLQRSVHTPLLDAASGVQKSFVRALEVVDRSLNRIVGHAKADESAKSELFTTHAVSCKSCRSRARATFNSEGATRGTTPWSSATALAEATDLRDYPGQR